MDDYDDYANNEEDIIEYYENDYANEDEDTGGINFEDMLIFAETSNDAMQYKQIIELEKDNSTDCKWSYKAYEKLCLIYIQQKNFDEFIFHFEKLIELYPRIDDHDKQDTIRNCTFYLNDIDDKNFVVEVLTYMLDLLKTKELERAVMDTGLQFSKTLFHLGRNEEVGRLIDELLEYMNQLDKSDEIYKAIKLELLVMKIQYCNILKEFKETKRLYLQASSLNQNQIINDSRVTAIINEEGGKLYLRQKNYDLALEKFKSAFYEYQSSGNNRVIVLLKYAILTSIISRNNMNIVSPEEARPYHDEKLMAMLDLQDAYEKMDFLRINSIWNEKISKNEDDNFILENVNEILHNIRFNFICSKLKAYKTCLFSTLEKELGVERNYLISLLHEIILTTDMNAKLNFNQNYVEMFEKGNFRDSTLTNFDQWIKLLINQQSKI